MLNDRLNLLEGKPAEASLKEPFGMSEKNFSEHTQKSLIFDESLGKNQSSELQVPIPPNAISVSGLTKDAQGNIILTIG